MRGTKNSPTVGLLHDLKIQIRRDRIKVPISGTMKAKNIAHVHEMRSTSEMEASNFLSLPEIVNNSGVLICRYDCCPLLKSGHCRSHHISYCKMGSSYPARVVRSSVTDFPWPRRILPARRQMSRGMPRSGNHNLGKMLASS